MFVKIIQYSFLFIFCSAFGIGVFMSFHGPFSSNHFDEKANALKTPCKVTVTYNDGSVETTTYGQKMFTESKAPGIVSLRTMGIWEKDSRIRTLKEYNLSNVKDISVTP
jgi:hypothetical protein